MSLCFVFSLFLCFISLVTTVSCPFPLIASFVYVRCWFVSILCCVVLFARCGSSCLCLLVWVCWILLLGAVRLSICLNKGLCFCFFNSVNQSVSGSTSALYIIPHHWRCCTCNIHQPHSPLFPQGHKTFKTHPLETKTSTWDMQSSLS